MNSSPGPWRRLFRPAQSMAVIWLLLIGLVVGAALVIGTQLMVHTTGSVEFCGGACHSMREFTMPEYRQSVHFSNRTGVRAGCSDCHVPHAYPQVLFYKAAAGIRDAIAEARGVIDTKEKYEQQRWRMANRVWDEMRANDSANCRTCHDPGAMAADKQSEFARKMHEQAVQKKATCIDCHKGVAHAEPEEPAQAAPPAQK